MQIPLRITFRNMDPSPAIEVQVRQRAAKLERFSERITSCTVVIEAPHHRHHKGRLYHVSLSLTLPPHREIVVGHERRNDHAHEDVNVALRDAFEAAARRLEDHARRVRGDVKTHSAPLQGRVVRLFPDYGFVETDDGHEIYFHRNSVVDEGFETLEVGRRVRLSVAENESAEGPQATTVHPGRRLQHGDGVVR